MYDANCTGDEVLAQATITPDRCNARFALGIVAGQSASLLNFVFLAWDEARPLASGVALARTAGQALMAAPRVDGLPAAQIATIVNFTVSAVREPASWAMMLIGFGVTGMILRRRCRPITRFAPV